MIARLIFACLILMASVAACIAAGGGVGRPVPNLQAGQAWGGGYGAAPTTATPSQIAYIGTSFAYAANPATTCSAAIPTNTAVGDLMIAYVVTQNTSAGPTPAGWAIVKAGNNNLTVINSPVASATVYYRYFLSGDAAPTFSGLSYPACEIRTYRYAQPAAPFVDSFQTCLSSSATSCSIPALANTANSNETVVAFWEIDQEGISNTMTGPAALCDTFTTWEADRAFWSGDANIPSAGTSLGALSASVTGAADKWLAIAFSLIPAVQAPSAPTITTQPQNISVVAGLPASFTAGAGGFPNPTLQFQQSTNGGTSWANVGSCSSNPCTYTIASTTAAMNNYEFRAVATNSQGSANSNAANLTITTGGPSTTFNSTWTNLPNPPSAFNNTKAIPALAFDTSIGSTYCAGSGCCQGCTPGTGSQTTDEQFLNYVGIKVVRVGNGFDSNWATAVANNQGLKVIVLASDICDVSPTCIIPVVDTLKNNGVAVAVVEGLNEPAAFKYNSYNGGGCGTNTDWLGCAYYERDLHTDVRADSNLSNVPSSSVTLNYGEPTNWGMQFAFPGGIPSGSGTQGTFPTGTVFSDIASVHNYHDGPNGNNSCPCNPNSQWDAFSASTNYNGVQSTFGHDFVVTGNGFNGITPAQALDVLNYPRIATEWDVTPSSDEYQAVGVVMSYLAGFSQGYSLMTRFGLIEGAVNSNPPKDQYHQGFYCYPFAALPNCSSFVPYKSADYEHSASHFLADTGDVANPGSIPGLAWGQSCPTGGNNGSSECHWLLLQKSTTGLGFDGNAAYGQGHFFVVAWYEPSDNGPTLPMTLNFGQQFSHANIFDLTTVVSPSQTAVPANPTMITSCVNCSSINWTFGYNGHPSGGMPPPVAIELY